MIIHLLLCFYLVHNKVLINNQQKHFQIEIGESYSQAIPLFFTRFQHSQIEDFKRPASFYWQPICSIKSLQKGDVRLVSSVEHTNTSIADKLNSKIVYRFEDLRSLRVFLDAIQVQFVIIAVYTSSQIVFYVTQDNNGTLHSYQKKKVVEEQLQDARFIMVNRTILLFTNKHVIKIHMDGNYQMVSGYQPMTNMFDDIKSSGDYIYIGGDQGLLVYRFDSSNNSLLVVANKTFTISDNYSSSTAFDVNEIYIEQSYQGNSLIYILDRQQGLMAYSLNDVTNGSTSKQRVKILMGGCQHFIVTAMNIYLTCPELLILNKKGVPVDKKHNSFYPYQISLIGERIFIFGYQQLAIYDVFGTILQQHSLHTITFKSFLLDKYLVSFSDSTVSTSLIDPEREELYCYTAKEDDAGEYTGKYVTSGLCSQYLFGPQDNKQVCQISYPFKLLVKNTAYVSYQIEIIVIGVWIILMAGIALAFTIKHHLVHKHYRQLMEEQTNENIEVVPPVNLKKGSNEEVS